MDSVKPTNESVQNEQKVKEEQIRAYRAKMKKFYDEELPLLRKQEEYERLQASIEVSKYNRIIFRDKQIMYQEEIKAAQAEYNAEMQRLADEQKVNQGTNLAKEPEQQSEKPAAKKRTLKSKTE